MNSQICLTVIVEKTGTGFSAYAKEIDGMVAVGSSVNELKANFVEVFQHYVDYENEIGNSIQIQDYSLNYVLDLEQFFDYFHVINKSAFAEHYVGINPSLFRQYAKKLAPLSDKKIVQISNGLHKLANELSDISLSV
ncbi:hypothetical protein G9H64_09015 [Aquirufa nivalisilvae]|jgi:predicted RNase H-like HicB family nuclease|uniref:Type II toxin-antitoxin system HicB family antitoxin n=1 Tax=Aquirufa nivalisilvae TaxID=2516557 RepID=A0A2S2DTN5_9BACT|nr:hypothetical protein [Aquirufa nivalisilvae]AWL08753.1 hypothetical protein HME7025_00883 [Aquirufa nivalisilvae]MCZ2479224.1 hypothetical protein [Aquirufa nivalisilvae]MCZ2483095.1 hypothetical protein [Aquirufa nivalisilvae]